MAKEDRNKPLIYLTSLIETSFLSWREVQITGRALPRYVSARRKMYRDAQFLRDEINKKIDALLINLNSGSKLRASKPVGIEDFCISDGKSHNILFDENEGEEVVPHEQNVEPDKKEN